MKRTKRFLVAVCLLLVSATLLGTASFAWFSMNTEVSVDGIEVEAYSDALFLEIANTNSDSAFDVSTTLNEGKKALRLVTNKFTDSVTIVKIAATAATGRYGDADNAVGTVYYVKADSDVTGGDDNFILATDIEAPSSVDGYYKIAFTKVEFGTAYEAPEDEDDAVDYYAKNLSNGTFTLVTGLEDGDNVSGYYTAVIEEQDENDVYNPQYNYFTLSGNTYTIAADLQLGSSLDGYYTIEEVTDPVEEETDDPAEGEDDPELVADGEEEEEEEDTVTPEPYYYVKNAVGNKYEYSCLGYSVDADLADAPAFFWGRAYSNALGQVQNGNTLNILGESDLPAYVYHDTVYLRSAENTNPGENLRIEEVKVGGRVNDLSAALRILFVATNGDGDVVYTTYDNGNASAFNGALFDTILGNKGEVVTVDMYVYFDGEDDVAKTLKDADAGILNGQTIEVKFAINKPLYDR